MAKLHPNYSFLVPICVLRPPHASQHQAPLKKIYDQRPIFSVRELCYTLQDSMNNPTIATSKRTHTYKLQTSVVFSCLWRFTVICVGLGAFLVLLFPMCRCLVYVVDAIARVAFPLKSALPNYNKYPRAQLTVCCPMMAYPKVLLS
eukprot:4359743-Amphidinium_carterae.1